MIKRRDNITLSSIMTPVRKIDLLCLKCLCKLNTIDALSSPQNSFVISCELDKHFRYKYIKHKFVLLINRLKQKNFKPFV